MPANAKLIQGCKLWDKITTKMSRHEYEAPEIIDRWWASSQKTMYSHDDYLAMKCKIDGNVAEVTVGGSPGHKTHIDLDKHELEYYDSTLDVNDIMLDIFKTVKPKVDCRLSSLGISCKGVKESNIVEVFKTLAMPCSMDFRLTHCHAKASSSACKGAEVSYFLSGPKKEKK